MLKEPERDLDGVEGGAFLYLVAYYPEAEPVGISEIFAQTSYMYDIIACDVERSQRQQAPPL